MTINKNIIIIGLIALLVLSIGLNINTQKTTTEQRLKACIGNSDRLSFLECKYNIYAQSGEFKNFEQKEQILKDQIKDDLGASPDRADCLMLTFADDGVVDIDIINIESGTQQELQEILQSQHDYPPPEESFQPLGGEG